MELRSGKVLSPLKLEYLPVEVTDMILDYCSVEDILNLAQTNKYWNDFITRSKKFRNNVQLAVTISNCVELMNCSREYVNIRIDWFPFIEKGVLRPVLHKFAPKIQSLYIASDDLDDIYFPELRNLTIHRMRFNKIMIKQMLTVHASQLEILVLTHPDASEIIQAINTLPKLRFLDIIGTKIAINEVNFKVNESITALGMWHDVKCLKFVPNLRILGAWELTKEMIEICFKYLLKLKVVEFGYILFTGGACFSLEGAKSYSMKIENYDFDKENVRNIQFVKRLNNSPFSFHSY